MASMILGTVGSAIGGPIGGWIGSAIGSMIDQWLFAPTPPDIEGPRLDDLKAVRSDPGTPIPLLWGADRLPGIVAATTNLIETRNKTRVGGKGGKKQTQITYTYHVDIDFMLSEGPILGVGRIWADGKLVRGTRYQMSLDTDENFEQTGGIPYSLWYKNNVYRPEETYWSYNPTYNAGIDTSTYYYYDPAGDVWVVIDEATAIARLQDKDDKIVIYQYDTIRERMMPVPLSHDYTGEYIEDEEPLAPTSVVQDFKELNMVNPAYFDNETVSLFDGAGTATVRTDGSFIGIESYEIDLQEIVGNPPFENTEYPGSEIPIDATVTWNFVVDVFDDRGTVFDGFLFASMGARTATDGLPAGLTYVSDVSINETTGASEVPNPSTYTMSMTAIDGLPIFSGQVRLSRTSKNMIVYPSINITWTPPGSPATYRDWPDYYNFYDAINDWSPKAVLSFYGPEGVAVYRGTDDQLSDPTMELVHGDAVPAYRGRAHIVFQRFELERYGNRIPNLTFEVVQSDDARIKYVIRDLMERANVDPSLYDIEALPSEGLPSYVLGYSIGAQTTIRAAMEPILEVFEVDAAEMGNQIIFRQRKRVYDHTIDYKDLAAIETGGEAEPRIKLSFRDVMEMPRSLGIRYRDPEREYQPNTGKHARYIGPSNQQSMIEYPAVIEPSRVKRLARDKLRDLWIERNSAAWTIPHKYQYISPTDIVYINGEPYDATSYVFKVTKVERGANSTLTMEGVLQSLTLYVPEEGEIDNTSTDNFFSDTNGQTTTNVIQPASMQFLDLPPLRDVDDNLRYYLAMGSRSDDFLGGNVFRAYDAAVGPYESVAEFFTASIIGTTTATGGGLLPIEQKRNVDFESRLTVQFMNPNDELQSVTVEQFFNSVNAAVVGDEIVCFKDAENIGDGQWQLSTFLRGRLDTEEHISGHEVGERFVFLDINALQEGENLPSTLNTALSYKPVAFESPVASATAEEHTNTGSRKRPFAPTHIEGTRDGSDNLTINWTRQNRISFNIVDGTDIPMSEDAETYEIEIRAEDDDVGTILHSATVNDAQTYEYSAAQQTTDGATPGDKFTVHIYQMSAVVGRGNRGRAIV